MPVFSVVTDVINADALIDTPVPFSTTRRLILLTSCTALSASKHSQILWI